MDTPKKSRGSRCAPTCLLLLCGGEPTVRYSRATLRSDWVTVLGGGKRALIQPRKTSSSRIHETSATRKPYFERETPNQGVLVNFPSYRRSLGGLLSDYGYSEPCISSHSEPTQKRLPGRHHGCAGWRRRLPLATQRLQPNRLGYKFL